MGEPAAESPPRRRPRWGLRTLGFLGLALLAIVTSASLGGHTFGTFGSLIFGLAGAAYCSVKGVREALNSDAYAMLTGRRPTGSRRDPHDPSGDGRR
jgi:peptidoglycan/LPS O-acetylase OafA/YrhL